MKHSFCIILLTACGLSLLSACAKKEAPVAESKTLAVQETVAEKKEEENVAVVSDMKKDVSDIANNGGYFVKDKDNIYFHASEINDLQYNAGLFGHYMDQAVSTDADILCYNIASGQTRFVYHDQGYGKLYLQGDNLWFNRIEEEYNHCIGKLDLNTGKVNIIENSTIEGIDADTQTIIASDYKEGNRLFAISENENKQIIADNILSFEAAGDGMILFRTGVYGAGEKHYLNCYDESSGKIIKLGEIPMNDYGEYAYPEQAEFHDGFAFLSYGIYEGTGHFFANGYYVKADLTKEGSLQVTKEISGSAEELLQTPTFKVVNGKMTEKCEGHVDGLQWGDNGAHSLFYDSDCQENSLFSMWLECLTERSIPKNIEIAEEVDGYICYYDNENIDSPEDSVGWRDAYKRLHQSARIMKKDDGQVWTMYECLNSVNVDGDVDSSFVMQYERSTDEGPWGIGTYWLDDTQLIYVKGSDNRYAYIDYISVSEDGTSYNNSIIQLDQDNPLSGVSIAPADEGNRYSFVNGEIVVDQSNWGGGFREGTYKKRWEMWQMDEESGNWIFYDGAGEIGKNMVTNDGWVTDENGYLDKSMGMGSFPAGLYRTQTDFSKSEAYAEITFNMYTNLTENEYRLTDENDKREIGTVEYVIFGPDDQERYRYDDLILVNTWNGLQIESGNSEVFGYVYPVSNTGIIMIQANNSDHFESAVIINNFTSNAG